MNTATAFAAELARRGGVTKAKIRALKGRRWKYPLSLERTYATAIHRYLTTEWKQYAKAFVSMAARNDAAVDLSSVPGEPGPAIAALVSIAETINKFNKKEADAFSKIALGEAWNAEEPWLAKTLVDWASTQVSLITKASNDMKASVTKRVRDGVEKGLAGGEIERLIARDLPGISFRRARVIARDQASKLNAELTQGRMTDAGLETYTWETSMDERVRGNPTGIYPRALPSHYSMQGRVCRWDNPSVCRDASGEWVPRPADAPTNHPGMEIMCRCVAVPNWEELGEVVPAEQVEGQAAKEVQEAATLTAQATETQDDALTDKEISEYSDKLVEKLVAAGVVPSGGTAVVTGFEIEDGLRALPPRWAREWAKTTETLKIEKKSSGVSFFRPDGSNTVTFTSSEARTLFHEIGHATLSRLSSEKYMEGFYKGLETRNPSLLAVLKAKSGGNIADRALQADLGTSIRKEFLDGLIKLFKEDYRYESSGTLRKRFLAMLAERGIAENQAIINSVSDWLGLAKTDFDFGWGHSKSYATNMSKCVRRFTGGISSMSTNAALSVEAGAEFFELAITKEGRKFLEEFLPETMKKFESEVIGL